MRGFLFVKHRRCRNIAYNTRLLWIPVNFLQKYDAAANPRMYRYIEDIQQEFDCQKASFVSVLCKSRFELWWNFGRPTWSLACEKNMFYMHAITKFSKGPHIEIHNNFQNMFHLYDSFNSLWIKSLYWCSLWWHLPGYKWLQ